MERERGLGLGSGWKSARIGVRVGPRGQPLGLELAVLRHSVSRYRLVHKHVHCPFKCMHFLPDQ